MSYRFNNISFLMLTKNSCNLERLAFLGGLFSALVLAMFSTPTALAQSGCSDPVAINCGSEIGECDLSIFDWQEGVDFLEGTDVLTNLTYDAGELGTGIPDTLLGTFIAGEISGFLGLIRRNAAGEFPLYSDGIYDVPAGYSSTSTGAPTLSTFATWNMIGFIDLGSYSFAELSVELLVDLDGAASTVLADFTAIDLSLLMGPDAASVHSFATNQNPASSFFEAFIPADLVPFNPEAQGEYGFGLRISNGCQEILFEEILLVNVSAPIEGCDQPAACNYAPSGYTLGNAATCDFVSCLALGCTNENACNYDPAALFDDGTCDYISCLAAGCTNPAACNYDPAAYIEDGTCDFTSCAGCVDPAAANYDPSATIDDGNCEFPGCLNPLACNYDPDANVTDGTCDFESCVECGLTSACNYVPGALIYDNTTCIFAATGYDCAGNCLADADGDGVCDGNEVAGCTDSTANNYNASATEDDGSCTYTIFGCLNPLACNYNEEATENDDSCEFSSCVGCTIETACNFNEAATAADNSTCTYPETGYDCDGNCLFDLDFDGTCDEFEQLGCADEMALNFDPDATEWDGSCLYAPVCNSSMACNTMDYEAYCVQVEVFEEHNGVVGTVDLSGMTTYRIYALCESPEDVVSSVAGDSSYPTYIQSTGEVFQSEFGGPFAQDLNPSLLNIFPELSFDSWLTIGLEGPPVVGQGEVNGIEGLVPWIQNFEETGTLAIQDEVGGAMFTLGNPSNSVAGTDLRVLLAQITTNGSLTGQLYIQFFPEGNNSEAFYKFVNLHEACFLPSDAACEFAESGYNCAGECLQDTDADGICDEFEVPGCLDPSACNFNPDATDSGDCSFAEEFYDCQGGCLEDVDGDGICDEFEVPGCSDTAACNFESTATDNDGSCTYPETGYDCAGTCLADADGDGICDPFEVAGCTDIEACNYDPEATDNDNSCVYAEAEYDCDGNCLTDSDGDGICETFEIPGCSDSTACNFNPAATDEDGSCVYAEPELDCEGNCIEDTDNDGICNAFEIPGCTDETALNYNPDATDDDGSCEADPCNPDVTPPYFTYVPADSTITCDQPMPTGMAMAMDDCGEVSVTFIDGPIEYVLPCPPFNYFCTRTFTATDASGNTSDTVQYITVVDTIGPAFIYMPADTVYVDEALGDLLPVPEVAVEDACDLMATWDSEDFIISSENDTTTIERIFTASDQCGNENTWTQIIIVYEATFGCTEVEACNYDPAATADDDSCFYAEEGYDCEGNCLEDFDGDGICDPFEVDGCTAMNACNYNPEASDDDGSCDYCSCAEGIVGNYGLEIEVVAEHDAGDLAGMTTYRFWVTTESPNDFVSSIYGSNQDTLKLTTSTEWYNTDLGGDFGQNINASLFDLFPELEYDSWLTIGLEQSVNSAAGEQEVTTLGPPTGGWLADFSAGQNVEINDEVGGAWFILNGATNGVAGDDLKVLVAQLTTDGNISGTLNAQIFGEGIGANDLRFHFNFEGTQWLNNGGLTNNCGCTDSEAYNYEADADYDNGECAYCELDFASIDVTDVSCFGAADGAVTVTTSGASTDSVLFTFIPGGPDGLDSTWAPVNAGAYEIQILDGNGCSAYSTFEVTEPEALVLTIDNVTGQTEGEVNGAIEITVTGGMPEYNFDWTGLSGAFTSENEDIDGLVAGDYGVTVTDANGCSISSDDITIEVVIGVEEWLNAAVQMYPNPTSDVFTLEFPAEIAAEGCMLQVHDAAGRVIASRQISAGTVRETVDVMGWSAGIYTIQITTIEHASTQRLQVQH